jgi:hypothetical protein
MKKNTALLLIMGLWNHACGAMDFVHPGTLVSSAELDYVKSQIKAGAQPWKGEFDRTVSSDYATREPHGMRHINSRTEDADISRHDAAAAYSLALLWYFTDDEIYAQRAIAILNSWAQLQSFNHGSEQDRIQAGWIGAVFGPAADIMRLYKGWSDSEIKAVQAMFRRAFYPQLNTASSWNGNVDLTQIDAIMAIAVFNEDEAQFKLGLERLDRRMPAYFYLTSDGPRPPAIEGDGGDIDTFWHHPLKWIDGLTQETCRDNGHHSQYALGSAIHAAEVAWHQGIDVYTENQERSVAAMELLAGQLTSGSMQGVSKNDKPTENRYDTFSIGYNHYHTRMGLPLPNTRKLIIEQIRPRAPRHIWNLNYETLTHGDLPKTLSVERE